MRFNELTESCWTGYRQAGMKKKGDRMVPNCVPVKEVKTGPDMTLNDLLYTAAAKAMHQAGQEGINMDYEEAIKKAAKIYRIPYTPSELPGLLAQRAEIDRKLAMLKQGKQVAKARRQEKLAPTPAGSEEWFKKNAPVADRIKAPTKSLEEAPIQATDDPNDPMIYGHQKANPMTLQGRIQQARNQLKDLARMADSNDLAVWEQITKLAKGGMFMGLEQNLEQIRHGIEELVKQRRKGGIASRGISKDIGE